MNWNRKKNKRVLFINMMIVVLLIICGTALFSINTVKGKEQPPNKSYISISINRNDTLWSIAKEHMDESYYTVKDYIDEVKSINRLNNDKIFAGGNLVIPIINE